MLVDFWFLRSDAPGTGTGNAHGGVLRLRVLTELGWFDCADSGFDPQGVKAVEAEFPIR